MPSNATWTIQGVVLRNADWHSFTRTSATQVTRLSGEVGTLGGGTNQILTWPGTSTWTSQNNEIQDISNSVRYKLFLKRSCETWSVARSGLV